MPAKQHIVRLTPAERAEVRTLIAAGTAPARQLMHARILLKADAGSGGPRWTAARIAEALEISSRTVARVRTTYATSGLAAALQRKRPARVYARRLDGAGEAGVVVLACSDPPAGHARWTLRLLASRLVELDVVDGIAPETVRQTLKKRQSSHG
jgi:homeodomain-containing protein